MQDPLIFFTDKDSQCAATSVPDQLYPTILNVMPDVLKACTQTLRDKETPVELQLLCNNAHMKWIMDKSSNFEWYKRYCRVMCLHMCNQELHDLLKKYIKAPIPVRRSSTKPKPPDLIDLTLVPEYDGGKVKVSHHRTFMFNYMEKNGIINPTWTRGSSPWWYSNLLRDKLDAS